MKRGCYDEGGEVKANEAKIVGTLNQPADTKDAEALRRQKVAEKKAPVKDPDQSKYARGGKVSKHSSGGHPQHHAPKHHEKHETPFVHHHKHGGHVHTHKPHHEHVRSNYHGK